VIAVAAQKGGVGKTTTSVTLAAAWARFHNKRVLLVDLDPQANVNLALRAQVQLGGGSLSDLLTEGRGTEVAEIATTTLIDGLDVTPADPGLLQAENRMAARIGKELILRTALEHSRTHYDLIVLDCPPNIGTLTVNALVAADRVLVPCNPAALAVAGVSGIFNTIEEVRGQLNPDLDMLGIVLTRVDGRNQRTNAAVMDLIEDNWGSLLLPGEIGIANQLASAQLEGEDIFQHAPRSRGAEQYKALADHLLELLSA
jgi:chromosome partitioning protein